MSLAASAQRGNIEITTFALKLVRGTGGSSAIGKYGLTGLLPKVYHFHIRFTSRWTNVQCHVVPDALETTWACRGFFVRG